MLYVVISLALVAVSSHLLQERQRRAIEAADAADRETRSWVHLPQPELQRIIDERQAEHEATLARERAMSDDEYAAHLRALLPDWSPQQIAEMVRDRAE